MAEAIWRDTAPDDWEVHSAGSRPSGYVHPLAIQALREIGLPVDGLTSKSTTDFADQPFDLAITVCDNAKATCPVLPVASQTVHWPFDDPADAIGSEAEKMAVFRRVRDEIKTAIEGYLKRSSRIQ